MLSQYLVVSSEPDGTTGETTSHLTRLSKNDSQVIGYSHPTRLPKDASQVVGYVEPPAMGMKPFDKLRANGILFNPDNPLARHSGAGRNPARKILREADNTAMLSRFRGELLTIWIPAFAGMTQFFLMDYLGLSEQHWDQPPSIRSMPAAPD